MESWLIDVKKVRIPRPKVGHGGRCCPVEPPKDYIFDEIRTMDKSRVGIVGAAELAKATDELQRAFQEKL